MDIIKTGLGLRRTIKNMARFQEIMVIFAKNGFDELIIKTGLHTIIPDLVLPKSRFHTAIDERDNNWAGILGHRLRKCFEELGPSFIKLGQLISTREDIFDKAFILEMKKLLDQVKGIPFSEAQDVIEKSLGRSINSIFKTIDPEPIGKASIGVVYKGKLLTGENVVIKVRRPAIIKTIDTDYSILLYIIGRLEKVSAEFKYMGLSKIIEELSQCLRRELDFQVEMNNCQRMRINLQQLDKDEIFYIPKVYPEFTREEVMVMEYLEGVPFSDASTILQFKDQIMQQLLNGIPVFVNTLLSHGFFHADLHGGNFFFLKNKKIGIIDFGLMGTLDKKGRIHLIIILYSLLNHNYENLVYELLDVAEYDGIPEVENLVRDVRDCLSPYIGLSLQQTNFTELMKSILIVLSSHRIYLPREWFIIFRALMTLDGVGRSIELDFDILTMIKRGAQDNINKIFAKEEFIEEGIWLTRDFIRIFRSMPRHLKWFLREFARRGYALEIVHRGYEKEFHRLGQILLFLGYTLLASIFLFSGVLLIYPLRETPLGTIPPLVWFFWLMSLGVFLKGWHLSRK